MLSPQARPLCITVASRQYLIERSLQKKLDVILTKYIMTSADNLRMKWQKGRCKTSLLKLVKGEKNIKTLTKSRAMSTWGGFQTLFNYSVNMWKIQTMYFMNLEKTVSN